MRASAAVVAILARRAFPRPAAPARPITVFAAASLTDVFPRIDPGPTYSFAGSNQLALQIRQGAPADVFASASPNSRQASSRRASSRSRVVFATNRLALIVPSSNPAGIRSVYDLARPGIKLVIAATAVPVGDYTRNVLTHSASRARWRTWSARSPT